MLRVGLVGCGFMGRMHSNVYSLLDGAQLVAVADHKPARAEKFGIDFSANAYLSLEAMFAAEELDAVDICLPTHLHKEATILAAQAGKHIFCEKPMALAVADADAMIEAVDQAGVQLMIGHCIRFWPEYALLKEITDDGRLGKLLSINLLRYGEFPHWSSDNWLADEKLAGGGVLDMHIHDTDFIHYLLGDPDSINSWGTVDERGPGHVFTTMTYPGCVAHLEGGWNLPSHTPFKMAFRAIFERGAAIMDAGPLTIYEPGKEPVVPEFAKMEAQGGGNISDLGGYYHELRYFVDRVNAGQPLEIVTPLTSRTSLETTLEEIRQLKSRA
ncbi:MAG: Gfo/Idh/MocA family oxidoreductase [Methanoregulaceae archaeon]|nr:Gfo/Idh/MocA family oxidoreductase [Methanoregulaceae archaeon]